MKRITRIMFATTALIALTTAANADIITLQTNTAHELMPLINRLSVGMIISSIVLGVSAIICCLIIKRKS